MPKQHEPFEDIAREWDADHGRVQTALTVAENLCAQIQLNPAMRVMEFGCGTGLVAMALHHKVAELVAVDSSPEMLNQLKEKIKKQGVQNIRPVLVDWEKEALPAGKYDLIYTSMSLHHIEDNLH